MPTTRLFYDDAYLTSFSALHVASRTIEGRPAVALDRTAFYPEGGGQPADRGTLGGVPVLDVQELDGEVWHVLAEPLPAAASTTLEGLVDWARRFDFMQQHHGQHLLSAAFEDHLGAATVSVHMGEELCTLDLNVTQLSPAQAASAEELANRAIWENRSVDARFVEAGELVRLRLRKQPAVSGPIRIVSVEGDFDHSPCGGTHPRRTGEVGCIVIRRWERRGDTTRVEFLGGARALRDYRRKNALLGASSAALSVGHAELPEAIARLQAAEERSRKALARAQERLLVAEAVELAMESGPVLARAFADRSPELLRGLAKELAAQGVLALLGLSDERAHLVFARPAEMAVDVSALLREAVALLGGKGGGRPDFAQGSGPDLAQLDAALEQARARALEQLS